MVNIFFLIVSICLIPLAKNFYLPFQAIRAQLTALKMAAGLGLEPRLTGPEPVVLPLDDPAMNSQHNIRKIHINKAPFNGALFICYLPNILSIFLTKLSTLSLNPLFSSTLPFTLSPIEEVDTISLFVVLVVEVDTFWV